MYLMSRDANISKKIKHERFDFLGMMTIAIRDMLLAFSCADSQSPVSVVKYFRPELPKKMLRKTLQNLDVRIKFFAVTSHSDRYVVLSGGMTDEAEYE